MPIIAAAIAESPSIYALVLSLTQIFATGGSGSPLVEPFVFACVLFMALLSLVLKAMVIPTGARLETHLQPEDLAPLPPSGTADALGDN